MLRHIFAALMVTIPISTTAQDIVSYETDQSFDDVVFGLESAILDRGLVIDGQNHVGEMLARTREDVGSDKVIYEHAEVYSFCSAVLSRKMMEADPLNIGFCPYDIFVAQPVGEKVIVGFRNFPEGPMKEVQSLLDSIARSATGADD